MDYPSLDEIKAANQEQYCRWWRFLPSPENAEELKKHKVITLGFHQCGGMTPALSKKIGWSEIETSRS